jgi:hypothetical protein
VTTTRSIRATGADDGASRNSTASVPLSTRAVSESTSTLPVNAWRSAIV